MGKLNWQKLKIQKQLRYEPFPENEDKIKVLCSKCGHPYFLKLETVQKFEENGWAYKCQLCRTPKQHERYQKDRTLQNAFRHQ